MKARALLRVGLGIALLGFVLSRHRLELYGICTDCREGRPPKRAGKGIQQVS